MDTKKSRILERLKTLTAIRDNKQYSMNAGVLNPLEFGGLIEIKYDATKTIIGANITKLGEEYLKFYSNKYKGSKGF